MANSGSLGWRIFGAAGSLPDVAFAGLDPSRPIICLSHNPDTAPALDAYGPQWILSGHTHGGQVRLCRALRRLHC